MKNFENNQKNVFGHTGFLLDKLVLKSNLVFGESFEVNFFDFDDLKKCNGVLPNPYSTIIIGPNGTGKSLLLKIITDIFLEINNLPDKNNKRYSYEFFEVSYFIGSDYFTIKNYDNNTNFKAKRRKFVFSAKVNDQVEFMNIENIIGPNKIIVSSLLLTDRFTIYRDAPIEYKYLGVRTLTSPSTARTRNYIKRTVDNVVNSLATLNTEIVYKIKDLLKFLNYKESFGIYYYPKYKDHFLTGELTSDKFISLFENFNDEKLGFSKRSNLSYLPFSITHYRNNIAGNKQLISDIVEFLNELKHSGNLKLEEGSKKEYFEFDVLKSELSLDKYRLLNDLYSLDLITYPSISLVKKNNSIDIEDASSGEYHFISTMIGLYASLSQNSIVLIDEPEISLHPDWQMQYMRFLKNIFKEFSSVHFIIASHSHFMVSDLEDVSSYLIGLSRDEDGLNPIQIKTNTYGWSTEQVLLDIFKLPTTRNLFIAERIGKILQKAATGKNVNLEEFKDELLNYRAGLIEEDPLHYTLTKIAERYKWLD